VRATSPLLLAILATVLAKAIPAQQGLRLVDLIESPMLYVSLEGDDGARRAGAPGADTSSPVQRLLADPAFDALFAPGTGSAAPGAAGKALTLVRGVLARSSGDLEIALTGVVPAAGQPLLVLRARLLGDEAERLKGLFEATSPGQKLVEPHRVLGGRQTYTLLGSDGRGSRTTAGPGELVELALVGTDLMVANDTTAMQELLQPAQRTTTSRRVLAADPRFQSLKKRLDVPPGSLLVYGDWQRLGQRLQTSSEGMPAFLLEWSGLGSARGVMASLSGVDANFTGTMLLDFDRPPADRPADRGKPDAGKADIGKPDLGRRPGTGPGRDGRPPRRDDRDGIDGWFAAAQSVPARSLLDELPGGGLGGLVLAVDLADIAMRSRRGEHMLHHLREAFREYGLDFERNVLGKLGERGTVQLLFRRGEGAAATELVSVYSARAKSRKAAAELFADLRRAAEQHGLGKIVGGATAAGRGPEVLELAEWRRGAPTGGPPTYVAVHEDSVLLAFDAQTIAEVVEEYKSTAKARSKRDAVVGGAISTIGGDTVSGLFDLDLTPVFEHVAAHVGNALGAPATKFDLSRIPHRHIGFLDLQPREGGVVLRICVLSSR